MGPVFPDGLDQVSLEEDLSIQQKVLSTRERRLIKVKQGSVSPGLYEGLTAEYYQQIVERVDSQMQTSHLNPKLPYNSKLSKHTDKVVLGVVGGRGSPSSH